VYFHVNLNFSKFDKKCIFLVSEQYIDSIMHGATIKILVHVSAHDSHLQGELICKGIHFNINLPKNEHK